VKWALPFTAVNFTGHSGAGRINWAGWASGINWAGWASRSLRSEFKWNASILKKAGTPYKIPNGFKILS